MSEVAAPKSPVKEQTQADEVEISSIAAFFQELDAGFDTFIKGTNHIQ